MAHRFSLRRLLIGRPLRTSQLVHQRLSKVKALAVFSSDALSSVAYATEEILLVLVTAGTAFLGWSLPITLAIIGLLIILTISYQQTIHSYPSGGGAYIVVRENLGTAPGLVAGAALLIDYVLTVAVSISAGVAAITSAFPELLPPSRGPSTDCYCLYHHCQPARGAGICYHFRRPHLSLHFRNSYPNCYRTLPIL